VDYRNKVLPKNLLLRIGFTAQAVRFTNKKGLIRVNHWIIRVCLHHNDAVKTEKFFLWIFEQFHIQTTNRSQRKWLEMLVVCQ